MQNASNRIHSIDTFKGCSILSLVFLHCAVYFYANLNSVDLNNPPFYLAVIGLMVMWGGIFALISGIVNSYRYELRRSGREEWKGRGTPGRHIFFVGIGIVLLHLIYNILTAPPSLNFETGIHQHTLVAQLIRDGRAEWSPRRFVQGTALQMIGLSLVLLSLVLPLLHRSKRPTLLGLLMAGVFMISGLLRLVTFPLYDHLLETRQYVGAFLLSPLASEPYPILPYFAFTLVGATIGFAMARDGKVPRFTWVLGVSLVGLGILGLMIFPTNLHGADLFWYAKTYFELGVFTLIAWTVLASAGFGKDKQHIAQQVARISVTVYALQMPLSEVFAKLLSSIWPAWNQTMGAALVFAVLNVGIWMGLVALWRRGGYRFTIEHLWVTLSRGSTKLDF